jgi:DNA-binding NarL/FixJ family response regulator
VVLIDAAIPVMDGFAVARMIRAELEGTHVIVMTGTDGDTGAIESIRAGAVAFLHKRSRVEDLLRSIRNASSGQVTMPAHAAARLMRLVGEQDALSRRESEVLCLVARGLANKQIARELCISESTVKCHVTGILSKLGLPSRTHVALYAARTGLVPLDHGSGESAWHERQVV